MITTKYIEIPTRYYKYTTEEVAPFFEVLRSIFSRLHMLFFLLFYILIAVIFISSRKYEAFRLCLMNACSEFLTDHEQ